MYDNIACNDVSWWVSITQMVKFARQIDRPGNLDLLMRQLECLANDVDIPRPTVS